MPELSRSEARTQFVDLLNETIFQALGLKETLEDERKALESEDLECIEALAEIKSACVRKLQDLDRKRMTLCASCGFIAGTRQMRELIAWCDDDELLQNRWQQLMVIAADSSALNRTNGAIIRLRQQQFESSLSVFRGINPGADTYGRRGEETGGFGHRALAEA